MKKISRFGLYVRSEQKEKSNMDILMEFNEPVDFLFFHLADNLKEIQKIKVDLVTPDGIQTNRRQYII